MVSNFLEAMRGLDLVSIAFRILISIMIGGAIGMERAIKNQPAGFRTYMLVCLGATLVMMTNQYICVRFSSGDPSRLGAQVVSGIGFLGAGTIIVTRKNRVRGLTTAAGLWSAACTGLAIGIGFYEGAILAGITILIIMTWLQRLDFYFSKNAKVMNLYMNFESFDAMNQFVEYTRTKSWKLIDIQVNKPREFEKEGIIAFVTLKNEIRFSHVELIHKISEIKGLICVEEV